MIRGIGALLAFPGIIFIRIIWVIFPVGELHDSIVESKTGMKFYIPFAYAVRAETGIGVSVIVSGALLIAGNIPETLQAFGRFCHPILIFVILCFKVIFGIYRLADNPCRRLTLPALYMFGVTRYHSWKIPERKGV
jgi:hypothetical protein